ncbi:MAG: hypothetical protein GC147_03630 [Porphyrobacter sp.]|nr:hypothetical protein [Porphyrobacter sp.]
MPPARLKRGGARNRRDRVTYQLDERQCRKLIDRSYDAWEAGQPLSRFITLAWGLAGIDADRAVWATGQFIGRASEWMRHHGHPMPWVWVQENGDTFGQHAHILLHVPPELDELFRPMPRRWVKAILGGGYVHRAVKSKRIAGASASQANPRRYEAALLGRLQYMLKCAPAPLEYDLGLRGYGDKPWGQLTRVIGKRAGVWQRR